MAAAPGGNGRAPFGSAARLELFKPGASPVAPQFRLDRDEGYSEETRSQCENDTVMRSDSRPVDSPVGQLLWEDILALPEAQRTVIAYELVRSLRTSSIAAIVEKLNPLLHLDPAKYLPPEITAQILSYLGPRSLLQASALSKAWRIRSLDDQLWKHMFAAEGWSVNIPQVRVFEDGLRAKITAVRRPRRKAEVDSDTHATKKRAYAQTLFGSGEGGRESPSGADGPADGPQHWAEQHGTVEADESPNQGNRMEDVTYHTPAPPDSSPKTPSAQNSLFPPVHPELVSAQSDGTKVNWQFLYKQKKRLEENWDAARYTNFQLPHPRHPEEVHEECVYTIQYSRKYLVSGSRDKTIRIWNLDTQRLLLPPLRGHTASVLCLQFDERPEQDIIISGGSDCQVLIWRFSTGKEITRLLSAHSESVLNLRFDDRYLITCSKDKTIKVWNRKQLKPTDDEYPSSASAGAKFPSYIVNMEHYLGQQAVFKPLKEYSLLMTLEGHTAAVNALQIYENQIVSASGDRNVKIWDIKTGVCLRTIPGHLKGIACVQFDGRRIVSGSSDHTVRIFDPATSAEVACLSGHGSLVRTLQADFGDRNGQAADLEAEARAVDRSFFEARSQGHVPERLTREQRRARNAGSRNPHEICAVGAKIPPGGGGSRWARIVSGSYDETVIIWKRDRNGRWQAGHRLRQGDAHNRASNGNGAGARFQNAIAMAQANVQHVQNALTAATNGNLAAAHQHLAAAFPNQPHAQQQQAQLLQQQIMQQQAQTQAAAGPNAVNALQIQAQAALPQGGNVVVAQPQTNAQQGVGGAQAGGDGAQQQAQAGAAAGNDAQQTTTPAAAAANAGQTQAHGQGQTQQEQQAPPAAPQQAQQAPQQALTPQPTPQQQQQQQQQPQVPPHHHHHHHHHLQPLHNARVFKLQFDARRIICCSQDPTIVGWDFANGDPEIIQASQFFDEGL
ncbi:hypothetical protein BDY21DRAFT_384038 [Lineolata rhizophorae]|uniref:F-box domain-containing protein n=1 Tax=Lineolata rhizophorae TaxID=578093 RepID=A0A6A6PAE8_9PEZI|nr:hypothetical protein BDY21DRAFT_384038 [Lineolata rhizophorae]